MSEPSTSEPLKDPFYPTSKDKDKDKDKSKDTDKGIRPRSKSTLSRLVGQKVAKSLSTLPSTGDLEQ